MSGRYRLKNATRKSQSSKQDEIIYIPGELGLKIQGEKRVDVPNRPGFVYVRLRNDLSETVKAFNDKVSSIYGLPVLVTRDKVDKGKYYIVGRDTGRYNNWGSNSAYLPLHGAMHSMDPAAPGIDPVWVWNRQFMPLMAIPSGSNAATNVIVEPGTMYIGGSWKYVGNTGTPDLTPLKPTNGTARMVLIFIDENGNPAVEGGADYFSTSLTGTYDVYPHIPSVPSTADYPIAAVRLVSGTTTVSWDNLYDLRQFFSNGLVTGSYAGSGGSAHIIQDDGTSLTARSYLNFVGNGFVVYDSGTKTIVSGTASQASINLQAIFTIEGTLATGEGTIRIGNHTGRTLNLLGVYLDCTTAPTGQAIIVDIHKDGTTVFTTQGNRPQIAASANAGNSTTLDVTTWENGSYLTMDRDQVGSLVAGADLTATVVYS